MKILIASMLFAPQNAIGAVRPTNFAKNLSDLGHDVTVITELYDDREYQKENIIIIRVPQSSLAKKFMLLVNKFVKRRLQGRLYKDTYIGTDISTHKHKAKISNVIVIRRQLLDWFYSLDWFNQCKKTIQNKLREERYDIVISSFGPIGSYWLGSYIHSKKIAKYWICDYRDRMVNYIYPSWLKRIYLNNEIKALYKADAITVVSQGIQNRLMEDLSNEHIDWNKTMVIPNGYEKKEEYLNNSMEKQDKVLKFCYTGALYNGERDMTLLLTVLSSMIQEKLIDANHIQIHYAGKEGQVLLDQADKVGMTEYIVDHGFIKKEDSLKLQQESDMLIVLSWNTLEEQGIITGKFLEYLQSDKPIIALISGDLPRAELSELIEKLSCGIACEYIAGEKDQKRLKKYILIQYNRKFNGLNLQYEPQRELISNYDYVQLTKKLEQLCYLLTLDNKEAISNSD